MEMVALMSKEKYHLDHFEDHEFECKCGCGLNEMDHNFVSKLDKARDKSIVKYILNSAHRCRVYNNDVGGKVNSAHLKGLACDIRCEDMAHRKIMIHNLLKAKVRRIGVYFTFLHVDDDTTKKEGIYYGES